MLKQFPWIACAVFVPLLAQGAMHVLCLDGPPNVCRLETGPTVGNCVTLNYPQQYAEQYMITQQSLTRALTIQSGILPPTGLFGRHAPVA